MDNLFGEKETDSVTWGKWSARISPQLRFPLTNSKIIEIDQNSKGFGELGSRVWDGSLVLARYITSFQTSFFENKKCIELGAGTGILGIVAASSGAEITISDKKSLLPLIEHNAKKNLTKDQLNRTQVKELFWGEGNPFDHTFDIVFGADLTYDFEDLPPLIQTMIDITHDKSLIYIAYGKERAATPTFLEEVSKTFNVEHVPNEQLSIKDITFPTYEIEIAILSKRVQ